VNLLVWGFEWRLALSNRRTLALRVVAPLSIVTVIATGEVPATAGAAVYATLFAVFGLWCVALPLVRDGERGIVRRVVRGGISPGSYLIQRTAAAASIALTQLLPAVLLVAVVLRASPFEIMTALGALAVSLWIAGLIGVLAAALSRSASEAGLLGGVALVLLLHMSGVFQTPTLDGFGAMLEAVAPFTTLHEAFLTMATGGAVLGGGAEVAWATVMPLVVWALATDLTGSLER